MARHPSPTARSSIALALLLAAPPLLAPAAGAEPHQLTPIGEWGSGVYNEL